ncbi:MAG: GlsB/YeaQ/YmgE family stress response membrane protein [Pseudomonadota bacterium]
MNFLIWIVIGGVIGWLASLVMKTDAQQGMILNVVVGIVGALLGGWLLAPLFGTGTINQNDFSVASLFVSFLGALVLLMVVNLFRRGQAR